MPVGTCLAFAQVQDQSAEALTPNETNTGQGRMEASGHVLLLVPQVANSETHSRRTELQSLNMVDHTNTPFYSLLPSLVYSQSRSPIPQDSFPNKSSEYKPMF